MENNKRLQRNVQNKVIGGVCSGLADYFGIDAIIPRVIFIALILGAGTGAVLYLIFWVLMPAGTANPTFEHTDGTSVPASKSNGNLAIGLALIVIGVLFLLKDFIPQIRWSVVWPILLIILGIIFIIPKSNKH